MLPNTFSNMKKYRKELIILNDIVYKNFKSVKIFHQNYYSAAADYAISVPKNHFEQ